MIKERVITRNARGLVLEVTIKQNRWAEYRALLPMKRPLRYTVTSFVTGASERHTSAAKAWACYDRYTIDGGESTVLIHGEPWMVDARVGLVPLTKYQRGR